MVAVEKVASIVGAVSLVIIAIMLAWGIAHPAKFECDMCVNEIWHIQKIDGAGLIEVCSKCYDTIQEEE